MQNFSISGNVVDIAGRKVYPATVSVENGRVAAIRPDEGQHYDTFIMPGFVDAHVHVESSMLIPSEFARMAVVHGTVATVSDPHEIANVLGLAGVRYMLDNVRQVPFKCYFGAPSCVPATTFETAGAELTAADIRTLFEEDGLVYLSEMMNFPGVLHGDPAVLEKIALAKELGKPVDGHAPGLRGDNAQKYIAAGITTDHECFSLEEALDKLRHGMKILIREGSAAKNFGDLHPLLREHSPMLMFCSDDKHPNDLARGHIDAIVRRSVELGYDLFDVLGCACVNPVRHYGLDVGLLRPGDPADFIVVDSLQSFGVLKTVIDGNVVAEQGQSHIAQVAAEIPNHFNCDPIRPEDLECKECGDRIRLIEALEGQLVTNEIIADARRENGLIVADPERDILKLAVVNRYRNAKPALAFIRNFGFTSGAIASCVAHDSHNIIAVGVSDSDICAAINGIIAARGGIAVASGGETDVLPLPVAGIMSADDGYTVAEAYTRLDAKAKSLGSELSAPFMTLSFMALLVIPALKLSDLGLFDGSGFQFVPLCTR